MHYTSHWTSKVHHTPGYTCTHTVCQSLLNAYQLPTVNTQSGNCNAPGKGVRAKLLKLTAS